MKKTLDLDRLMTEAEVRAKKNAPISTDKEVSSEMLKNISALGQADDKSYPDLLKEIRRKNKEK